MNKLSVVKARGVLAVILLLCALVITQVNWRENAAPDDDFARLLAQLEASLGAAHSEINPKSAAFTHRAAQTFLPRPRFVPPAAEDIARLSCFDYLTRNIFLVDRYAKLFETDVNVAEFLAMCQRLDLSGGQEAPSGGPQVLIFHAHSREMFADSDPYNLMTGVVGVGHYLAEILARDHGLEVKHYIRQFDVVDGRPLRDGAYERLEPVITQILADNPSIQLVIDLHRDGLEDHVPPPVTYINGQRTARIMFVNGLSRRYRNGVVTTMTHLPNPYQRENLAFTLHLQLAANQMYPGFARRAYLLPFRYSLHMAPKSILLEVGAQNNTLQEALNAMPHIANVIAAVVLAEYS